MARPWVRLVLVFAGFAAIAAAGFLLWSSETHTRTTSAALRLAEDAGRRALADAAQLRSAQQGYVAVGQGEDFWFARVDALSSDLDDVLSLIRRNLSSPEAFAAVDAAAGVLRDFQQIDRRARDLTRATQLSQASDVIFGDGFEVTEKLSTAIGGAMSAERVAHDAVTGASRRRDVLALAGAGGVLALVLLILVPVPRKAPA